MNNANPLVPQGSLQPTKNRSQVRIVVFAILAVHVIGLTILLVNGCKKDGGVTAGGVATNDTGLPPFPGATNLPADPGAALANPLPATANTATQVVTTVTTPDTTKMETPVGAATEHVVQKGESFYTIARKYNTTISAIAAANPNLDPKKLQPNMKLVIPAATPKAAPAAAPAGVDGESVYTVKAGDNLTKIAKAHATTPTAIKTLNGLRTDQIKAGDKLKIPAPRSAAPSNTATAPSTTTVTSSVPPVETIPAAVPGVK